MEALALRSSLAKLNSFIINEISFHRLIGIVELAVEYGNKQVNFQFYLSSVIDFLRPLLNH